MEPVEPELELEPVESEEPTLAVFAGAIADAVGVGVGVAPMGVALGVLEEPEEVPAVSALFMKVVNQSLSPCSPSSLCAVALGAGVSVASGSSATLMAWVRSPL